MLKGERVTLRTVRQQDLPAVYDHMANLELRGEYYPRRIMSAAALDKHFAENGLWSDNHGSLLMTDPEDGRILGEIEFFKTVAYLDEFELSYILYDRSARGAGVTTEAVRLMTDYLFDTVKVNRIRLVIHSDNAASRRVAEKNGFRHEGTMRGAWFNRGRNHDVELYAVTRADLRG